MGRHIFANSSGFAGDYRSSYCSLSTSPVAKDGESMERDYWYTIARGYPGLEPAELEVQRQVVRHGHLQVNGRKVNIPSFQVKVGDEIAIREGSKALVMLEEAKNFAAGQNQVQWLDINRDTLSGKVIALPKREDVNLPVNEQLIVELYSK